MKIERHETGPRMSRAVIHGETVYLAGIVADGPKGKSAAEQTRNILAQIDGFLAMAGTDKTKLLSANIWITDMAHFAEMNTVWEPGCLRAIRRRERLLRPSLPRPTTGSRSWSWPGANSVGPQVRKGLRGSATELSNRHPPSQESAELLRGLVTNLTFLRRPTIGFGARAAH